MTLSCAESCNTEGKYTFRQNQQSLKFLKFWFGKNWLYKKHLQHSGHFQSSFFSHNTMKYKLNCYSFMCCNVWPHLLVLCWYSSRVYIDTSCCTISTKHLSFNAIFQLFFFTLFKLISLHTTLLCHYTLEGLRSIQMITSRFCKLLI